MTIFNSYVKLPEGTDRPCFWPTAKGSCPGRISQGVRLLTSYPQGILCMTTLGCPGESQYVPIYAWKRYWLSQSSYESISWITHMYICIYQFIGAYIFFVPSNCWWHGLYFFLYPHLSSYPIPKKNASQDPRTPRTPSHAGSTSSSPLHPAIARGGRPSTHLQRHGGPPDGCGVPSVIFEDLSCLKNIHGNMYLLEWMYIYVCI